MECGRLGRPSFSRVSGERASRVDDDLVPGGAVHHRERVIDLIKLETVRHDFVWIDQLPFHQANRALHGQRGGAEARVHATLKEMSQPAIELELFVGGDAKKIPPRAAAA